MAIHKNMPLTAYLIVLTMLVSCVQSDSGYFDDMPATFHTDSLSEQRALFEKITVTPMRKNEIEIRSDDCSKIPFCGDLFYRNDTIFHRSNSSTPYEPYLLLNARRFDTLTFVYSPGRADRVVFMGLMWDKIRMDSIKYFQLIPLKRPGPAHIPWVRYIAVNNGGIRFLTFESYMKSYTVALEEYPKVTWSSD